MCWTPLPPTSAWLTNWVPPVSQDTTLQYTLGTSTAMTNKALYTNVSIKKTGFVEVMPGQQIRYDFSGIANNSTTHPLVAIIH